MQFNQSKYDECERLGGHEYGYNENAGHCEDCGLMHDCDKENKFEYDGTVYICTVCHVYATPQVVKEIEQANYDERVKRMEAREALR